MSFQLKWSYKKRIFILGEKFYNNLIIINIVSTGNQHNKFQVSSSVGKQLIIIESTRKIAKIILTVLLMSMYTREKNKT